MLNNYHYFIALAEEQNISKAAERLFVSHQCLSKYLKNLEQEYQIAFFERTPRLSLTPAGQVYLQTLRQIEFLENNMQSQLEDIRHSRKGIIRFGTTEGRYRMLVPDLLADFNRIYPDVKLITSYTTSDHLCEKVLNNELDLALINHRDAGNPLFERKALLDEKLYLVISDHVLAQYFPEKYPACKESFRSGVNLAEFAKREVPFILNKEGFNSRILLDEYTRDRGFSLNCVLEMTQQDLHFMLAARDYAACFCWEMYLAMFRQNGSDFRHLNVFPIKGISGVNQLTLITAHGKILPAYGKDLIDLIRQHCTGYAVQ